MQFLILSDLHANWYALEAVLMRAKGKYQQIICCGDLVGYNPHPDRVICWTRANCSAIIRGNHDKVVAGLEDLSWFNEAAQAAAVWTMDNIAPEQLTYLRELPMGPVKCEHFHIWHGSAGNEDEYIAYVREATPYFGVFELPLAFFGHTHLQGGFFSKYGRVGTLPKVPDNASEWTIEMESDALYMVNPGSVGQPRDMDPRAAYAIYDSDQKLITLYRVEYPVEKTAEDIQEAGLPDALAIRLFYGM